MALQKEFLLHGAVLLPQAYIKIEKVVYDSSLRRVLVQCDIYANAQVYAEGKSLLDSYLHVVNGVDPTGPDFNTLAWGYAQIKALPEFTGAADV